MDPQLKGYAILFGSMIVVGLIEYFFESYTSNRDNKRSTSTYPKSHNQPSNENVNDSEGSLEERTKDKSL